MRSDLIRVAELSISQSVYANPETVKRRSAPVLARRISCVQIPDAVDEEAKRIGAGIAALRGQAGLTQTQLAAILGCATARISEWETGVSYPRRQSVAKLAEALGVTREQILSGSAIPETGVEQLTNETLKAVLNSPEWAEVPPAKRLALVQLFNDLDLEDYEIKSVLAMVSRKPKKRAPVKRR